MKHQMVSASRAAQLISPGLFQNTAGKSYGGHWPMFPLEECLLLAHDGTLINVIQQAKRHLTVIAPGVSCSVAEAIAERWRALGPRKVSVSLSAELDAYRLGIGDVTALHSLHECARQLGTSLNQASDVGISVIVSDDFTLIYWPYPFPLLAKEGPPLADGLLLNYSAFTKGMDGPDNDDASDVNADEAPSITPSTIETLRNDLAAAPPHPLLTAEMVTVFNTYFQFVELELHGTAIDRKAVRIPPELLGLANNDDLRKRIRTNYRLVGDEDLAELSGRHLLQEKKAIMDEFLILLPGYGSVVMGERKKEFEERVRELESQVAEFKRTVETQLQAAMDRNQKVLIDALFPAVKANPPKRWKRLGELDDARLKQVLEKEIQKAFQTAKELVGDMKVKCLIKGVTQELIKSEEFIAVAREAIPGLDEFHSEYRAIRVDPPSK
jgi:hypothetical protein